MVVSVIGETVLAGSVVRTIEVAVSVRAGNEVVSVPAGSEVVSVNLKVLIKVDL